MKKIIGIILLSIIHISLTKTEKSFEPSQHYININENIDRTDYSTILIRKSRETNSNNGTTLLQGTDSLRNQISNFSESLRKEISELKPPNSTNKIANLENEIKKVKEEIELLKNAPNVDASSKTQLSNLENAIETLQKLFDDNRKLSESQMAKLESVIDSLTASVSAYRSELEKLKALVDERERADRENRMPAEIAQDIRDGEVHLASSKFLKLTGDARRNAAHVIRAADIKQGNSFELVISFGNTMHQNSDIMMKFYEALRAEMESVNLDDVSKFLKLIASVKFTIVDNTWDNVPEDVKRAGNVYLEDLVKTTRNVAARKFEDAMIANNYRSVADISKEIQEAEIPFLFRDIIKQATSNAIQKVEAYKLVNFIREHKYISQWIYGFSAIFNELKSRKSLDNTAVVSVAFGLKDVMGMVTYAYTTPEARAEAEAIKSALPKSVRNLAFSKLVCIKNTGRQERLYAEDYQSYDESRRRVYAWVPGTRKDRDQWAVVRVNDVYFIQSFRIKEYFYAADDNHKMDLSRRRVLTWIPGDMVIQGQWLFEPSGDDVYIKNVVHNEYLYADFRTGSNNRQRAVFTYGAGNKPSNSLWTIEECN